MAGLMLLPLCAYPLIALLCAYLVCDLYFSVRGAMAQDTGRMLALVTLPFLFFAVHIVYGVGTLAGLIGKTE